MARLENKAQYDATMERIEELLAIVTNNTSVDDKNCIELAVLSDLVEEYEEMHFPIGVPSIADILKLRMYEQNITQKDLGNILGVSVSRISEYMTGKAEPTLRVARIMVKELNISPGVILGGC